MMRALISRSRCAKTLRERPLLALLPAVAIAIGLSFVTRGPEATWRCWRIPTMTPAFADLRTITEAGVALGRGLDPRLVNPGDPWRRRMNYPSVWLLLPALGVGPEHTVPLGITFGLLFVASVAAIGGRKHTLPTAVLLLLTTFSPAAMLALERGNTDLVVFSLVTVFALCLATPGIRALAAGGGSLLAAAVLKLYPIAALAAAFVRRDRRSRVMVVGVAGAFLASAVLTMPDLLLIVRSTPISGDVSYGYKVMQAFTYVHLPQDLLVVSAAIAIALLAAPVLWWAAARWSLARCPGDRPSAELILFTAGASIYVITFLLGSNWDYRLIFLIPTVPKLMQWSRTMGPLRFLSTAALACIVVSCWYLPIRAAWLDAGHRLLGVLLLDEIANWMLFYLLGGLLISRLLPGGIGTGQSERPASATPPPAAVSLDRTAR